MAITWNKTNDYYDRNVVTCDVWSKVYSTRRAIYIMDSKDKHFQYTFSCGANSDYSFTGSFYETNVTTLEQAIEYLNKFAPLWFADNYQGIRELKATIEK